MLNTKSKGIDFSGGVGSNFPWLRHFLLTFLRLFREEEEEVTKYILQVFANLFCNQGCQLISKKKYDICKIIQKPFTQSLFLPTIQTKLFFITQKRYIFFFIRTVGNSFCKYLPAFANRVTVKTMPLGH